MSEQVLNEALADLKRDLGTLRDTSDGIQERQMDTTRTLLDHTSRTLLVFLFALSVAWAAAAQTVPLRLEQVATGLDRPLFLTAPSGDLSRLFILERAGLVRIVKNGTLLSTPFIDPRETEPGAITTAGEEGLLGMAFHPNYAVNGLFYLSYTSRDPGLKSKLVQYKVSDDPDRADNASRTLIYEVAQPTSTHNGGCVAFGPDGYLYFSMGDGGGQFDLLRNAQNIENPYGSILRFDVDTPGELTVYSVPLTNPFVDTPNAVTLIWAYGLRNPWRFSFDRLTGDLWIGDVGQNRREEINFQPASSHGGENYGWNRFEGMECFTRVGETGAQAQQRCADAQAGIVFPVHDYTHDVGISVTGGYVYRGGRIPWLRGTYFFADFAGAGSGPRIWSFRPDKGAPTEFSERTDELTQDGAILINSIASFGEDADGEIYVLDFTSGAIHRMIPETANTDVDANGLNDALDIQLVINAVLGIDVGGLDTDVNDDGSDNALDIQLVINGALAKRVESPATQNDISSKHQS